MIDENKGASKPARRARRSKKAIENDIEQAAIDVISEVGFENATIINISQRAKIETVVFYNRYKDIEEFIDKFVRKFDYWLSDLGTIDEKACTPLENIQNLLTKLVDSLNSSPVMQKLLVWELSSDNRITQRTAMHREVTSSLMLRYFMESFKDYKADFRIVSSLIIGGIYYLVLHQKRSTFCDVDLTKPESLELLKNNIRYILDKIYLVPDLKEGIQNPETNRIAKNLIGHGVSMDIIQKSTGLSLEKLESLKKEI